MGAGHTAGVEALVLPTIERFTIQLVPPQCIGHSTFGQANTECICVRRGIEQTSNLVELTGMKAK